MSHQRSPHVRIIGAGIAGLTCAAYLNRAGVACTIHEASQRLGGRLGSDTLDGFTLDRGFQVFLTSYPEARRLLDYSALHLGAFTPGALIYFNNKQHRFVDPFRRPASALATALSPVGTFADKLRVALLRRAVLRKKPSADVTTLQRLGSFGFSQTMIDRFFRPFYAGVFLENDLSTSSRMFDFTFGMFASGDAALPRGGMQAVAEQLRALLTATQVIFSSRVQTIDKTTLCLDDGQRITSDGIIIATDACAAARLLPGVAPRASHWAGTTCVYFSASVSPLREPILWLDASQSGPINHVCVPSDVAEHYAPPGRSLVSCTAIGVNHVDIESAALRQLRTVFGSSVQQWSHIKTYVIPQALPDQSTSAYQPVQRSPCVQPGIYIAGDHCDYASINGAMSAGRRAAEAWLADHSTSHTK
jgi:protoporphyrinogen oxidase